MFQCCGELDRWSRPCTAITTERSNLPAVRAVNRTEQAITDVRQRTHRQRPPEPPWQYSQNRSRLRWVCQGALQHRRSIVGPGPWSSSRSYYLPNQDRLSHLEEGWRI